MCTGHDHHRGLKLKVIAQGQGLATVTRSLRDYHRFGVRDWCLMIPAGADKYTVVVFLSVCSSVCPSVFPSRYCIETTGQIELVFGVRLPSTCPTLSCMVLPFGTLSQTWDLETFATANRSRRQQLVDGRACWRHLYDNRRVVAVYHKSANCNPLTSLLRFVLHLSYNLFLQLTRFRLT